MVVRSEPTTSAPSSSAARRRCLLVGIALGTLLLILVSGTECDGELCGGHHSSQPPAHSTTRGALDVPADDGSTQELRDSHRRRDDGDSATTIGVTPTPRYAIAGSCQKAYKKLHSAHTSLTAFVRMDRSVGPEGHVAAVFSPSLGALCDRTRRRSMEDGKRAPTYFIVDVGANDGEEIPLWVKMFGARSGHGCSGGGRDDRDHHDHRQPSDDAAPPPPPAVRFLVVEPQSRYQAGLRQIAEAAGGASVVTVVHAAVSTDALHGTVAQVVGSGEQAQLVEVSKETAARLDSSLLSKRVSLRRALQEAAGGSGDDVIVPFLKVDCEGADATIIVDSLPLFAQHRVWLLVFEANKAQRHFQTQHYHAASALASVGYSLFLMGAWAGPPVQPDEPSNNKTHHRLFGLRMNPSQIEAFRVGVETVVAVSPQLLAAVDSPAATRAGRHDYEAIGGMSLEPNARGSYVRPPVVPAVPGCIEGGFIATCAACGGKRGHY